MERLNGWVQGPAIPKATPRDVPIVALVVFKDRLYLATADGVFVKDENDDFQELKLVYVE